MTAATAHSADRVFDGHEFLCDHAVLVDGGLVRAVCPRGEVPADVPVHHTPGATLLPGLIDAHVHHMRWEGPLFLAYGVTAIRDIGNDLDFILSQRAQAPNDVTPRIVCVGPLVDGPRPGHPLVSRACASADEGVAAIHDLAAAGVDGIKLYHNLECEWLPAMVATAHRHGLRASMHCVQTGVRVAADAGTDEFFHLDGVLADVWPDHPPGWLSVWGLPGFRATRDAQCRLADHLAAAGIVATPTLAYWESQWRLRDPAVERALPHVPAPLVAGQGSPPRDATEAGQWRAALAAAQEFVGLLVERGVRVLAGSDVPCGCVTPGLSLWHEMRLLAQAGMSTVAALQAATSAAADFLGQPQWGRLAPGAYADMVVVAGDLSAGLAAAPEVLSVIRAGAACDPAALLARSAEVAATAADDPWGRQLG